MPLTIEQITAQVERKRRDLFPLHARMDSDYDLWRLAKYNTNPGGGDAYTSYTSNAPRSFADKIVGAASQAKLFLQMPVGIDTERELQARYDSKERFLYSIFRQIDEQFLNSMSLPFQAQAAWFLAIRGMAFVRAAFNHDGTVDVRFWDPRNVYFSVGPRGLAWICHVTDRLVEDVEEDYQLKLAGHNPADLVEVFDWWDRQENAVAVGTDWLKRPTPHASNRLNQVPVGVAVSGNSPLLTTQRSHSVGAENYISNYGDSIYSSIREVYNKWNEIMSIYMDNVQRGREQSYIFASHSGEKKVEGDINEPGGIVGVQVGESISPVQLPEIAHVTGQLAQLISGEFQRGTVAFSSYGDPPFSLSGVALNLLNQSNTLVLVPILRAMEGLTSQVAEILSAQYATGAFSTVNFSGTRPDKKFFSLPITPTDLVDLPHTLVKYVAELPQDDSAALQFAQIARQGPVPLFSDKYLWENKLGVQDTAALADEINAQLAERVSPTALDFTLMSAAMRRGEEMIAKIYALDLQARVIMGQMRLAMLQGQGGEPQNLPNNNNSADLTGTPPGNMQEVAPVAPPVDARKVQPMTSPRPGAREANSGI